MTPCIDEAVRLLRLAERDYRSFAILASHPDADAAAACFHAQQYDDQVIPLVTLEEADSMAVLILDWVRAWVSRASAVSAGSGQGA